MKKYSVTISGHATSITLEEPFWQTLKDIAREKNLPVHALIESIDESREAMGQDSTSPSNTNLSSMNLSSAIRVYILQHLLQNLKTAMVK